MAPTAAADIRQAVLSCVRSSSSSSAQRVGELFSVDPESSTPQQWADASLPYNTRLADEIGPLAIVYPRHPGQIAAAIQCAGSNGVPAVARSGGHSYGAYSLGGSVSKSSPKASSSSSKLDKPRPAEESLIIDMREFRHVDYDAKSQLVRVGSGAMLGELNEELERHGRMVPSGSCPTVGVGGQVLAGGFGLASRAYGLLLDNLVSAEVVLASGETLTVSQKHHPDLFWGIRGAGPSLAIGHSFTFRTHPMPQTVTYFELTLLPRALPASEESAKRATALFSAMQQFGASEHAAPDLGFSWHVTPESTGTEWGTKVEILGQWIGSQDKFDAVMRELETLLRKEGLADFELGKREMSWLESMHNTGGDWTKIADRGPLNVNEHVNFYAKSLLTKHDIPDSSMQAHMTRLLSLSAHHNPSTNVDWFVLSPYLGGESSAVRRHFSGAFGHRDVKMVWELYAKRSDNSHGQSGANGETDLVEFVNVMAEDLGDVKAVYPAYVDPELGANRFGEMVYGDSLPRLQGLKRRYDPSNVFRQPQTIRADGQGWGGSVRDCLLILGALGLVLLLIQRTRRARRKTKARLA